MEPPVKLFVFVALVQYNWRAKKCKYNFNKKIGGLMTSAGGMMFDRMGESVVRAGEKMLD